jgi:hypothetical protein
MTELNATMQQLKDLADQYMRKTRYDARYNISYAIKENYNRIYFHDNRFPHMSEIGHLRYKDNKFVVHSRLIKNSKYKHYRDEFNQKECVKPERALKNLIEFMRPLSMIEVSREIRELAKDKEGSWRSNASRSANSVIRDRLTVPKIVEEITHLAALGVEFKTDEFRNLVKEGLALYAESKRIAAVKVDHNYVHFMPDGRVMLGLRTNHTTAETKELAPEEPLPEEISNNLALLKMLGSKEFLPEMGFKKSDTEYIVFTPSVDSPSN